jgi:hypothetical protein
MLKCDIINSDVNSDAQSRPGFEAGPRPRPIWAYQARPEVRPGLGLADLAVFRPFL